MGENGLSNSPPPPAIAADADAEKFERDDVLIESR